MCVSLRSRGARSIRFGSRCRSSHRIARVLFSLHAAGRRSHYRRRVCLVDWRDSPKPALGAQRNAALESRWYCSCSMIAVVFGTWATHSLFVSIVELHVSSFPFLSVRLVSRGGGQPAVRKIWCRSIGSTPARRALCARRPAVISAPLSASSTLFSTTSPRHAARVRAPAFCSHLSPNPLSSRELSSALFRSNYMQDWFLQLLQLFLKFSALFNRMIKNNFPQKQALLLFFKLKKIIDKLRTGNKLLH